MNSRMDGVMMVVVAVEETSACLELGWMRTAIPWCTVNLYKYFFLVGGFRGLGWFNFVYLRF